MNEYVTRDPVDREGLAKAIADAALLRGEFVLRSGKTSNYYLDKYKFSTRPELLKPVAQLLAERIEQIESDAGVRSDRLAGAELGGIPLVAVTSLVLGRPTIFVRNAKKDYGTAQQLEGAMEPGERVVFLEDVATTAGQALEAVGALREAGLEVLGVIATIDREEGARANVEGAGYRFEALFTKTDLGVDD
ncbi:MAG: orotate phosphoribosyltransferase [Planctomycetota bacterium]